MRKGKGVRFAGEEKKKKKLLGGGHPKERKYPRDLTPHPQHNPQPIFVSSLLSLFLGF